MITSVINVIRLNRESDEQVTFLTVAFAFLCPKVGALDIAPSIAGNFNIDRVELYIKCYDTGSPNTIVNTGFGGAGSDGRWSKVVTEISKTNRICLYYRANLGKSDKSLDTYDVSVITKATRCCRD